MKQQQQKNSNNNKKPRAYPQNFPFFLPSHHPS